jgi:glycosyltransferase involved in cell wall biosynthesis
MATWHSQNEGPAGSMVSISVIIPVLNRVGHIGRAIASVADQGVDDLEIIVVDGGSTDGTQAAAAPLRHVRLIEAPNSSMYEALNVGIRQAKGPLISHLNSDDRLLPGSLQAMLEAAASNPSAAIIRGLATYVAADGGTVRISPQAYFESQQTLDLRDVTLGWPAINSCFIRAQTYRGIGLYDETLRIAADREWLVRALLARTSIHFINRPVYEYLLHDESMTMRSGSPLEARYAREHLAIAARYLASTTDRSAKRTLRAWHAREVVRLMLRADTPSGLAADIRQAFSLSPLWPILSIRPLLQVIARRLR